jgi:DNA-binding MarR family transcriptional regulator
MSTEHLAEELLTFTRMLRPLRHSNMTPQQYWLLRQLSNEGPLRISELAQALGVTTGTATVACQRLEKSGLLTRERQIDDERVVLVMLTKQGQALIEETLQKRRDVLNQLLQVLTKDEQTKLQQIIEHLLHAAEAQGM